MVRAEHVIAIRESLVAVMKNYDQVAARAVNSLIANAQVYRHCILDPARDSLAIDRRAYRTGESCVRDLQADIDQLRLYNVHLPDVPTDELVDTLAQAVGFD